MNYWRIRKEWNDGKWDKTQKGAYTSYESAFNNYTTADKIEGYKIFSPMGEVLYPHHEITQLMINDNIKLDTLYWDKVFNNNENVNCDFVKTIICRYSELLNDNDSFKNNVEDVEIIDVGGLEIYKVLPSKLKVRIVDKNKKDINYDTYINAGYFGLYKELVDNKYQYFTLPVANIVADYSFNDLPTASHKYLKERKITSDKIYFGANDNGPQFKNKSVSTLIIYNDNSINIERVNDIKNDNIKYAISGYPIIINYDKVLTEDALNEGWELSVTRNTYHNFIGIKEDGFVYMFYYCTKKAGKDMIDEVFNLIKDFNFKSLIKLDGGGSAIFKYDNNIKMCTNENRQINSIIYISKN